MMEEPFFVKVSFERFSESAVWFTRAKTRNVQRPFPLLYDGSPKPSRPVFRPSRTAVDGLGEPPYRPFEKA